ncbi:hypothetical protein HRR75_007663 [Exophiala dermatitidis]|nr:hypothetical protein HRR75_007663 [Exophiala dermatitidis]
MSALVAYESSSEDDEPVKPTADSEAAPVEKPSTAAHTVDGQNGQAPIQAAQQDSPREHQVQVVDGPMVGPTMPDRVVENGLDGETTPATQQSTSERDAVRFLTQASHPMTSIPSSPPGSPDSALNAKFARFLELKAKGVHFNEDLASKSTFRNPSFLSTMVARDLLASPDLESTGFPELGVQRRTPPQSANYQGTGVSYQEEPFSGRKANYRVHIRGYARRQQPGFDARNVK